MKYVLGIYLLVILFYLPLTIFYMYEAIKDAHEKNTFTILNSILHAIISFIGGLLLSPIAFITAPYVQLLDRLKKEQNQ